MTNQYAVPGSSSSASIRCRSARAALHGGSRRDCGSDACSRPKAVVRGRSWHHGRVARDRYSEVIESLLGIRWEDLEQPALEGFLAEAREEGLLWEAKSGSEGRWVRREQVEQTASAFGNSHDGGLFIAGASRRTGGGGWDLDGLCRPGGGAEVVPWFDQVIRDGGVRPIPPFRAKEIELDDGKVAGVLWVRPTPTPPCITRDGRVFLRTSERSVAVTDPAVLSRLTRAGEEARMGAETRAAEAARQARIVPLVVAGWPLWHEAAGLLTVAAAAVGYDADIGGRVFHERFRDALLAEADSLHAAPRGPGGPPNPDQAVVTQGQNYVVLRVEDRFDRDYSKSWVAAAWWNGAVLVACRRSGITTREVGSELGLPWRMACRVLRELGGFGPVHVVARTDQLEIGGSPLTIESRRWSELTGPSETDIKHVEREIRRAAGEDIWLTDDG